MIQCREGKEHQYGGDDGGIRVSTPAHNVNSYGCYGDSRVGQTRLNLIIPMGCIADFLAGHVSQDQSFKGSRARHEHNRAWPQDMKT